MQILGSLIWWHHVRAKELGSFRRITLIFVLNIWIVCPHTRDLRRIYQDKFVTCICLVGNNEICVQTLCISSQLRLSYKTLCSCEFLLPNKTCRPSDLPVTC